jgi:hypothetical protein
MLAYIPASTEYRDLVSPSPTDRLAAVTAYQALGVATVRNVVLPRRYGALLREIYNATGIRRHEIPTRRESVSSSAYVTRDFDAQRSLLRIHVEDIGTDLGAQVNAIEREHPCDVTHVDLVLSDHSVSGAVEDLHAQGFFFCALLPEYAASDVLRLQRLHTASWVCPDLVTSRARKIRDAILADRESTLR